MRGHHEGKDHGRPGVLGAAAVRQRKSPAPMMAPMPRAIRLTGPERAFQLMLAVFAFANDACERLDREKVHVDLYRFGFRLPEEVHRHPQQNENQARAQV